MLLLLQYGLNSFREMREIPVLFMMLSNGTIVKVCCHIMQSFPIKIKTNTLPKTAKDRVTLLLKLFKGGMKDAIVEYCVLRNNSAVL
mmetsp:Transcript_8745/g.11017  ORF Transcript_8745/g.11017 Transcript_8745/m.11017 type:complete len:87 (+) Transcript_8745:187-447(+)